MRDHALEKTVAQALAADPRVDDDTIAVECFARGHVVLRGSAESPAKATRALRAARGVAGARDVEDQLRPRRRGVGRSQDARTEAAVFRAFISDDALPAETIHVTVSDGTVTLSGSVDFPYQLDEAEAVARQVTGVWQIRNHLSVWIAVSPNEVLDRVAEAIGVDSADQLTVTARDNVVTLTGTVRSTAIAMRRSPRRRALPWSPASRTRSAFWRDRPTSPRWAAATPQLIPLGSGAAIARITQDV